MKISVLSKSDIGCVYTPSMWARWLIDHCGVYQEWQNGKSVCDPTGGQGIFLLQLIKMAKQIGGELSKESVSRLGYIEKSAIAYGEFKKDLKTVLGDLASQVKAIRCDVILETPDCQFDILIGNPPWANFADLENDYKELLKPAFVSNGLVPSKKAVLLGSSRVDIAALIVNVALGSLLRPNGSAHFYLPTSLFFGGDAHRGWRSFSAKGREFRVTKVFEFTSTKVFKDVGTSYCAASIKLDTPQVFPVELEREVLKGWKTLYARPLKIPSDQWIVTESPNEELGEVSICVRKEQAPRQGINTCGANSIFIFDCKPSNLPAQYLFPLATKELWRGESKMPVKWILLPYNPQTAKPLAWLEIQRHKGLAHYLQGFKDTLSNRKGVLIQSAIKKGFWWSLLGVGPYSFSTYKVIWQAYGKKEFRPIVLGHVGGQAWQGNQAMNAFMPCWNQDEAEALHEALLNPSIEDILRAMNGEAKCNWAQPGKMKKVLSLFDNSSVQESLF